FMAVPHALLTGFAATAPRYHIEQADSLAWIARAHAAAARLAPDERVSFAHRLQRAISRCACPPSKIARRGVSFDVASAGEGPPLYLLRDQPLGVGTAARTAWCGDIVDAYFTDAYAGEGDPPDELIHVTCTGYLSPSAAQKLVAAKRW